ncbi:MAG: hypothetical protein J6A50_05635 [Clostridia bacterium]|nr:hypothetical protein [Clostridia bacterium]
MASRKKKSNLLRIIAVLCGCLGAGWLFSYGWNGMIDLCLSYKSGNIFNHFFSTGLFVVATLLTAILFFVVSIKDLSTMKEGVSVASIIIDVIVGVFFVINIVNAIVAGFGNILTFGFLRNIAFFIMILAYVAFAFYCLSKGKAAVAWTIALVAVFCVIGVSVYGFIIHAIYVETLINNLVFSLAHAGVFYCGLKQY